MLVTVWQNSRKCRRLSHRVQPRCRDFESRILCLGLKQRILSDLGHLSNEDGAEAMIRAMGNRTRKSILGILSKENNIKELSSYDYGQSVVARLIWESGRL